MQRTTWLSATGLVLAAVGGLVASHLCVRPVSAAADVKEGKAPVAVVELFTSEGCSSCPPADDLLRRIAGTTSDDGQTIIALSEHVTYWNNLGWADPFSQEIFTARQAGYVAKLHLDDAYTPQAVVNGRVQFVGSDSRALARALHLASQTPTLPMTIDAVNRSGAGLSVQLRTGKPATGDVVELWAAVTDDADVSRVERGENGGRTLRHAAVVRSLVRVGTVTGSGGQTLQIPLPAAVASAAREPHHLVLLAQNRGQGYIVGAATRGL